MKRRLRSICLAALLLCMATALEAWAQIRISGRVIDAETQRPLAGVKVQVKGSNLGTLTSKDGTYSISTPAGSKALVFSYVGMKKVEKALGESSEINVEMVIDSKLLDDVVVTALGVERDKRSINYAVQDIKAGEIVESAQPNIINALQGRIAGVQITNAGGAPGANSSIIIRGGNSVDADNQPLFIIDGIPMDNSTTGETNAGTSSLNNQLARSVTNSNRGLDINPEDIESMSVLKGPAAAALYGQRAANGVILITTKRGFKERMEITYSGNVSWDQANRLPQTQSVYKQGTGGFFDPGTRLSWGPRFQPGEQIFENMQEFFQTGFSQQHNVNVSGASDRLNYFFSGSYFNQQGIVPLTNWSRLSVRFNGGATILPGLKLNTNFAYTNSGGVRVLQGNGLFGGGGGYMNSIILWPKNDNMKEWQLPDGSRRRLLLSQTADIDNPYFSINKNPISDNVDRILANGSFLYDITDWLNVTYRFGVDITNERTLSVRAFGSSLPASQQGSIAEGRNNRFNWNSQLLITAKWSLSEDLKGDVFVGNWVESEYFNATDFYGRNFINPDFISVNNTDPLENRVVNRITERRLVAVQGGANINWRDRLYIGLSARNDWSSTLPINSRSFLYYSATAGYVFSDDLGLTDVLSYGKLRASYSRVGKDPAPYRTGTALTANTFLGGGFRNDFWGGNPSLKPEITEGVEAGVDLKFFENRFGIDLTLYQQTTYNQLIAPRISQASGFIFAYINGGTVQNQGVELLLSATPVRSSELTWFTSVNFTRNIGRVVELPAVLQELNQSDAWVIDNARGSAFPGRPLQAISINDFQRSPDGKILIDSTTGYPFAINGAVWNYGGDRQPDAIIGWTNSLTFDNFTFSFLWDFRIGGKVLNGTEWSMVGTGMSMRTLDRYKRVVLDGVIRRVSGTDTTYVPNTREVELTQGYYQNFYQRSGANFVEDASWIRLRTVTFSYRFPRSFFEGTPITGAELTLTGRNLLLFTPYTGMDPEVSAAGAGVRGAGSNGMDFLGVPATRGITLGLRLSL